MQIDQICPSETYKIILSGAAKNEKYIKPKIERKGDSFTLTTTARTLHRQAELRRTHGHRHAMAQ